MRTSTQAEISESRRRIREYLVLLGRLADVVLGSRSMLVRASLFTARRRCGKVGCRCARGELHARQVVSVRRGGRSCEVSPRGLDLERLGEAIRHSRTFRRSRAEMVKIFGMLIREVDRIQGLQEVSAADVRQRGGHE